VLRRWQGLSALPFPMYELPRFSPYFFVATSMENHPRAKHHLSYKLQRNRKMAVSRSSTLVASVITILPIPCLAQEQWAFLGIRSGMTTAEVERVLVPRYGDSILKNSMTLARNISNISTPIKFSDRSMPQLSINFTDDKACTMSVFARYKGEEFERLVWFKDNQYGRHSVEIGKGGVLMTWHPHTNIEITNITRESTPSGIPGPVSYGVSISIGYESGCSPYKSIAPSPSR